MNEKLEAQLEEARRLLPTPPGRKNPARRLGVLLLVYVGLVLFFIICFHVFNNMQPESGPATSTRSGQ
jgi:hypothetical protein